jgi:hypothetical protein
MPLFGVNHCANLVRNIGSIVLSIAFSLVGVDASKPIEQSWGILLQEMLGCQIISNVENALHMRIVPHFPYMEPLRRIVRCHVVTIGFFVRHRCDATANARRMNPTRSIVDAG